MKSEISQVSLSTLNPLLLYPDFNQLFAKQHFLDWSKLNFRLVQGCADDKMKVNEKLKFVLGRVENNVGKEKMLVTSIFSFPTMFSKGFFYRFVKCRNCVVKS